VPVGLPPLHPFQVDRSEDEIEASGPGEGSRGRQGEARSGKCQSSGRLKEKDRLVLRELITVEMEELRIFEARKDCIGGKWEWACTSNIIDGKGVPVLGGLGFRFDDRWAEFGKEAIVEISDMDLDCKLCACGGSLLDMAGV
jgi:hypothetical protein